MKTYQGQFDPQSDKALKLSRTKVESFIKCPKCFYLDRRLKVKHPPSFPFNLNSAVDNLLKKEFDIYRANKTPHPLQTAHKTNCIPYQHMEMLITISLLYWLLIIVLEVAQSRLEEYYRRWR